MLKARIIVRNKKGVFDPEGKVVHSGLGRLGYDEVKDVKVGKVIDLEFATGSEDEVRARVERMCQQFLVNPVIEDYSVEFTHQG